MGEYLLVDWDDATQLPSTFTMSDTAGVTIRRRTVGLCLRDNPDGLFLAMSEDEGAYQYGFGIPRPYIVAVEILRAWPTT